MGWGKRSRRGGPNSLWQKSAATRAASVLISALLVSGCAHDEPEWAPLMYLQAEIADGLADTYCSVRRLFNQNSPSSDFAAQADPELMELARRDAQRACLKGLETDAEERARRMPGRNNI